MLTRIASADVYSDVADLTRGYAKQGRNDDIVALNLHVVPWVAIVEDARDEMSDDETIDDDHKAR